MRVLGLTAAMLLVATPAAACTLCHSPTALGVRHLILHHDLGRNAAAIAAPIPILAAAILFAVGVPSRRRKPQP